jgi:ABC-2 type transport system permease protein
MWNHFFAILWAQSRITRNHFSRTGFGTVLSWTLSVLWYGAFLFLAIMAAVVIAQQPLESLQIWLPVGLLGLFLYMQLIPLVTLSSGWSLQLDKLQVYPVSALSLFTIEVLLRVTSAPEMLILLAGGILGLLRRPDVFFLAPFSLLLFIPFNLLLQLAIRDFLLHAFNRNRFRELLIVLFLSASLLPQLLIRSNSVNVMKPYLLRIAGFPAAPWKNAAFLSLGFFSLRDFALIAAWIVFTALLAYWQFNRSLLQEDAFLPAASATSGKSTQSPRIVGAISGLFRDPMAAIIEKELRSLVRMPRFRVLFGMACVFSVMVFFPMSLRIGKQMPGNFLPVISLYGLLLLSDALLLNIFGFDRAATQIYFVAPLPLAAVIKGKNCVAALIIGAQTIAIPFVSLLFRMRVSWFSALSGICASAVVTIYLMAAGNLLSANLPRPIDPKSTFRRQAGAKVQMWLLACTLGMALLVGFAYLARWATDRDSAFLAVLALEFAIGLVIYKIALDSAIEKALQNRESIVSALSKNTSPVNAG